MPQLDRQTSTNTLAWVLEVGILLCGAGMGLLTDHWVRRVLARWKS